MVIHTSAEHSLFFKKLQQIRRCGHVELNEQRMLPPRYYIPQPSPLGPQTGRAGGRGEQNGSELKALPFGIGGWGAVGPLWKVNSDKSSGRRELKIVFSNSKVAQRLSRV